MKFGVGIPTCREGFDVPPGFGGPKELVEVSKLAERLGVDFVWGSDFLTPIPQMREKLGKNPNWYEVITTLAYVAATTKRIGLGIGVIVLPFREPIILAKQIATLDVCSGGRLIFGVGLGGIRQEFEMLFPRQAKVNRGAMLEEQIQVLRRLLTEPEVTFEGKYYALNRVSLYPKPAQNPFPIYLSGRAPEVPDRVARLGDGWVVTPGSDKMIETQLNELRAAAEKAKKDIARFHIFADGALSVAKTREAAIERFQKSRVGARFATGKPIEEVLPNHYIGAPAEVAEKINRRKKLGVTHCVAQHIAADDFAQLKEQVHMFAEEVIPLCK